MASKNDIEIKVGVTGAKKSIDQLEKLFDAFRNSESSKNLSAHQVAMQQLSEKAANNRRLHSVRMMNLTLEQRKQTMSLKLEEGQINLQAKRVKLLGDASTLAEKEAKAATAAAKAKADITVQEARAKAAPKVIKAQASADVAKSKASEIRSQEQINQQYNKTAESVNRVATSQSRASQAATSALKAEIQLEATLENSVIRNNNQRVRGQILTTNLSRAITKQAQDEQSGILRTTKLSESLDNQRQKEADRIIDRARRIERQQLADERREQDRASRATRQTEARGGIFSGLFSPRIAETISVFSRLSIAAFAFQQVIRPIADTISQSLNAFSQYTQTMRTLETVTINTGTSFQQARELVNRFNDGLSDRQAVAAAVRTFSSMNIELTKQGPLIEAMRDGIVAMGGDVNEQLPLMALAIKRNSSELLDNMGITKNVDEMYKEYAKSIHKSVSALTQQEKDTAVMNGVLQELQKYSGIARDSQGELTGQIAKFNTNMHEMTIATGEFLSGPGATILDWLNTAVDFWGKLGKNQDNAIDSLSKQLKYTPGDIQKPLTGREAMPELVARNRAILAEINKNTAAGIRTDAPIMNALRERGLETLKAMQTIRNKEKANQKKSRDDKKAADEQSIKDDEIRVRILMAKDQTYEAEKLQARVNFANNQKTMSLKLAKELFNAEMAQADRHHKEKQERDRKRAEEEAKRKETERKRAEREARESREKAAEQAIGRIGTFKPELTQADVGANFEQRRSAERENIKRIARAKSANQKALADLNALDTATNQQSEETHKDFTKRREEIQKLIKDQQGDISEHQREIDKIDAEEKKQIIQETADFLQSSYQVALQVLQGDFGAALSSIGETIGDAFVKNASELDVVQDFVGGLKNKINKFMTDLGTVDAFKLLGDGLVLYGMYKAVEIGTEIVQKFYNDVNKKIDEAKQLYEEPETLRQKKEKKISELQSQRSDLQGKQFWAGLAYVATGFGSLDIGNTVKNNLDSLNGSLGETDNQIKLLGESFDNDLSDPLSKASIALRQLTASVEMQRRVYESEEKTRNFLEDLKTKTALNQIDIDEKSGKITKEEADKKRFGITMEGKTNDVISTLLESLKGQTPILNMARSYIKPYLEGKDISELTGGTYSSWDDFFQKNATWMTQSTGQQYTPEQLKAIFEPLKTFLGTEGRANAPGNMPGSSPDKPMYTQVVNVRDFREAFPDSAYFRTGGPMMNSSTSLPVNSNTATSRTGRRSSTTPSYA